MKSQVDHIMDKVGAANIARWCRIDISLPYKWRGLDRGMMSGFIPANYHHVIIAAARAEGFELTPDDFIQFEDGLPPLGARRDIAEERAERAQRRGVRS